MCRWEMHACIGASGMTGPRYDEEQVPKNVAATNLTLWLPGAGGRNRLGTPDRARPRTPTQFALPRGPEARSIWNSTRYGELSYSVPVLPSRSRFSMPGI